MVSKMRSRQSIYCPNPMCRYTSFDLYLSGRQCIRCHKEQLRPRKVRIELATVKQLRQINNYTDLYSKMMIIMDNEIYNILGE